MLAPLTSWADFEKLDIRTGTVVEAEEFSTAKKPAYRLRIDFGQELGVLQSSAQITKLYSSRELINKQVIAVVNFAPKNIAGFMSQCLVLGAYNTAGDVVLIEPNLAVQNGAKIG